MDQELVKRVAARYLERKEAGRIDNIAKEMAKEIARLTGVGVDKARNIAKAVIKKQKNPGARDPLDYARQLGFEVERDVLVGPRGKIKIDDIYELVPTY